MKQSLQDSEDFVCGLFCKQKRLIFYIPYFTGMRMHFPLATDQLQKNEAKAKIQLNTPALSILCHAF